MANVSTTIPELMNFDFDEMLRSKQALRQRLTSLPIAEKFRLLDALRERALVIRGVRLHELNVIREEASRFKVEPRNDD
jgi:hypothetical protein